MAEAVQVALHNRVILVCVPNATKQGVKQDGNSRRLEGRSHHSALKQSLVKTDITSDGSCSSMKNASVS